MPWPRGCRLGFGGGGSAPLGPSTCSHLGLTGLPGGGSGSSSYRGAGLTQKRKMSCPNPHRKRNKQNSPQRHLTVPSVVIGSPLPCSVPHGAAWTGSWGPSPVWQLYQVWRSTVRKLQMNASHNCGQPVPISALYTTSVSVLPTPVTVLGPGCLGSQTCQALIRPKVKGGEVVTLVNQVPQNTL